MCAARVRQQQGGEGRTGHGSREGRLDIEKEARQVGVPRQDGGSLHQSAA